MNTGLKLHISVYAGREDFWITLKKDGQKIDERGELYAPKCLSVVEGDVDPSDGLNIEIDMDTGVVTNWESIRDSVITAEGTLNKKTLNNGYEDD
jgi:hypothetical protein